MSRRRSRSSPPRCRAAAAAVAVAGAYAVVLATRDDAAASAPVAGGSAVAAVPLDPAAVFVHVPVAAGDEAPVAGSALAAVGSGADAGPDEGAVSDELAVSALADLDADGGGTAGGGRGLDDDFGAGGAGGGAAGGGSGIPFPDPPFSPPAANGDGSGGPGSGFGPGGGGGAALPSDPGGGSANGGGFYPAGAPVGSAPGQPGDTPRGESGGSGGAAGANGAPAGTASANPRGANSGGTGGTALAPGPTSGSQTAAFTTVDGETVPDGAAPERPPVARAMGGVPGYFERNVGQVDRAVDYVARGTGYTLFLQPDAVTVSARVPGRGDEGPTAHLIRLRLAGADPHAVATGTGGMDLKVSYLLGDDTGGWVTGVPTVARVDYAGVYPGVDATYYADPQRGLAFDFTVRPGADASAINLAVDGGTARVTDDGRLAVETEHGTLTLTAPVAYQDGTDGRAAVAAEFVRTEDGVGFSLGDYDPSRAVVIDPGITWGSFVGGSADDGVRAVATDSAGNSYLAGYSYSADLPGAWTGASANSTTDVMVAKLSPDGKRLLYVMYVGGSADDAGYGIAVGSDGAAYVVGDSASTNFPVTSGALDTSGSGSDGFALKVAPDGQSVAYATYVSPAGSAVTTARGVAVDGATGEAVVVGQSGANLAYATATVIGGGTGGAYVLRLNAAGTAAVYNTTLNGSMSVSAEAAAVALGSSGAVFATGVTAASDFMGTTGMFGVRGGAFVTKLTSSGTVAGYVVAVASIGLGRASGTGAAVDGSDNAFVSGYTDPIVAPVSTTTGAFQTTAGGSMDGFVLKLNSSGATQYATYLGGSGLDQARGIALDANGNALVAGWSDSGNFPTLNALQSYGGGRDAFLTKLDPSGAGIYSTFVGDTSLDEGYGVAVTPNGDALLAGVTQSAGFPATGGFAPSMHGGSDGFVVRVGPAVPGPVTGSWGAAALNNVPSATGPSGVRPDGSLDVFLATDLSAGGFEGPVAQGRTFGNVAGGWSDGLFGSGWFGSLAPSVRQVGTSYAVVFGATEVEYFDLSGSVYVARYDSLDTLDVGTSEITFTDGGGNEVVFYSYDPSISPDKAGRFKKSVSAGGLETEVTAETGDGKISEIQRDDGTTTESWLYAYVSSGVNAGLVSSITLRRKVGAGGWNTVRKVEYDYYDGTTAAGTVGALKTATIKDGSNNVVDRQYYRYYAAGESGGYAGALKFVFDHEAHERITVAYTTVDSATDTQAAPYAAFKLEYDSDRRVTTSVVGAAGCSVCSGGQGEHTVAYATSGNTAGANAWNTRMTETLPDGSTRKTYTNADGAPMLVAFTQAGAGSPSLDYFGYSSDGKLELHAHPSAVSGYSESDADLVGYSGSSAAYLRDTDGLIETITYGTSTTATTSAAGDVDGMTKSTAIQQGETGTPVPQTDFTYIVRTASSVDYYFPATSTVYRNDNGTGGITTSAAYTWVSGTAQVESVTTTLPTVTTGQNGSNSANTTVVVADSFGRPVWYTDAGGFLHYTEYDPATGAVVKTITDVDDAQTTTFANLPSGWTTPSGGGLHLTTTYEVDTLGRTTKATHPNGRIDYTVFDDAAREVRFYAGWDSINDVPTGPTVVMRTDLAGGYSETLTMIATPSVNSGRPTGGEAVANVQSLSRSYRNAAGQTTETDVYFNLSGLTYSTSTTLGTEGVHFYRTRYQYDDHGMVKRVQTPEGTITRTVRDGLGRVTSVWVGTDDTPTSGFWSPTNTAGTNLVKVAEYEYDGGGIGDNNLTSATRFPGGGAADRVTNYWHDWRNRTVAVKQGVETSESADVNRPLTVYEYDNLNRVTQTQLYDGDGVTPSISGGVLSLPGGTSAKLRAQSANSFDELGRVYRTDTYSVDPLSGSVGSDTLYTEMWFDPRGGAVKVVSPGGLVQKMSYDGAGRMTAAYRTDGGGDSGYADAFDVAGDTVLEQSEYEYDDSGNVLTTVTRQRFHNASGTGVLGDPTSGIGARVSYTGFYYDLADRIIAAVDVGTNGGSVWSLPGSVPGSSSTVHVTLTSYAADAVQTVALTGGPTGGTFTLTFGGHTTGNIAYNASASAVESALEALASVGSGNVAVIDALDGAGWEVRFTGSLAASYQPTVTGSGTNLTGGTGPDVAVSTVSLGGDAGRAAAVTDPAGREHRTYADPLGRTVRSIENFTDGVVASTANKTVGYAYNGAGLTALTAYLTGGTFQTTGYVFGVSQGSGSAIDSNDVAGVTQWADPTTGAASASEQEVTTVNALGATLTYTDRTGSVHTLSYDAVGRLVSDAVTTLASGVDGAVRRIEYGYDTLGNLAFITSYDAASGGSIVNQVQRAFNGLGQLITEWQEHGGAVRGYPE